MRFGKIYVVEEGGSGVVCGKGRLYVCVVTGENGPQPG
jgi:hypothetical protein